MREITADTVIDGRYQIIDRVGSGGMADVWCATDLQLGRKVALKLLHQRFNEDEHFVERFRREAQSAAGLQHQHVVSVYDRGEWDGTYYIAMEYLEGRPLKDVVRAEGPFDPLRAIDVTVQILRAARFAHRRGIIHRDIKPQNVILDEEDRAKVTDFGIARAGASDMTETGSIMGTAQYLSPEQAQGHAVSAQSDLYAIGIVLYEMLTGQVPFDAESAVTIALKQVSEAPVPPSHLNPAVPAELEAVVQRALEKDPAQRYQDADEMVAALEEVRGRIEQGSTSFLPPPVAPAYVEEELVEQVPAQPRRPRWPWAVLAGLLVAGAIVAALLLTGRQDLAAVPDVVGAPLAAAETRLEREGFEVETRRVRNDEPRDTVIGQNPRPGERAEEGSTVTLAVSDGPGTAAVPDVIGQERAEAEEALEDAGFRVDVRRQFDEDVEAGRVIETRPPAGSQIDRGARVTLVVSRGAEEVEVPDVTGQRRDAALAQLRDAGFDPRTEERETDQAEPGTVVEQDPEGGTEAEAGSTVTVTVAVEPEEVDVPDVTGRTETRAAEILSGRGFEVNVETTQVENPSQDGRVQRQSPSGGSQAAPDSTVTIVVGDFDESQLDPEPDPPGNTTPTPPEGGGGGSGGGAGADAGDAVGGAGRRSGA